MQNTIRSSAHLIVEGAVTLAMVILAFLAFDDITTDNATTFTVEYSCLLACAIWCLVLVIRLAGTRHFVLGGASAVGWFLVLSLVLIVSGVRCDRRHHPLVR